MSFIKQSILLFNHKYPGANQSTAGARHFGLVAAALLFFVAYILIDMPTTLRHMLNLPESQVVVPASESEVWEIPAAPYSVIGEKVSLDPVADETGAMGHSSLLASYSPAPETETDTMGPDAGQPVIQPSEYLGDQPWIVVKVKKGDTLTHIFQRVGLKSREAIELAQLEEARILLKMKPGQEIRIKKDAQGKMGKLQYALNRFKVLNVVQVENQYFVGLETRVPEIRTNNAKAVIHNSLYESATEAGIAIDVVSDFAALFGWQVDFAMDLRSGDQFSIIYEELFLDDEKVGNGEIIAAELVVSGKKLRGIRHVDEDGSVNYYSPDGEGIRGTFLRTPLEFGRVTSKFSNRRLHPIKKIWTAHKGVDYGAPTGTPVLATGKGRIIKAGRQNGYGKTVIIRHGRKYQTLYAHLSRYAKGIASGARVEQGDVIGYVGSTGLATGPHLHYEFRVNGVHKNPVTVQLPKSDPIPDKYKPGFLRYAAIWASELDHLSRIYLAQNETYQ